MREILGLVLAVVMFSPVFAQRNIGPVDVTAEKNIIPVRVSANTPELNRLAIQAFGSHGRYRVTQTGYAYAITFNASGTTQVLLNITKGSAGTAFYSQTITGENAREALLRLHLMGKALYEINYEADNRPDWIGTPVRGVLAILDAEGSEA